MGKKAILVVKESISTLESLYKKQGSLTGQKRILALKRIKESSDATRQNLAIYLCIHIRTLERWVNKYESGGISGLLEVKPRTTGSKIISPEVHEALSKRVNNPHTPFLGYWDAQTWLQQEYGIEMKYHSIRAYLIRNFGTKVKRGRKSHVNKDPKAQAAFLKTT